LIQIERQQTTYIFDILALKQRFLQVTQKES